MGKYSFRKKEHLTKRPQFEQVMDQGKRYRIENFCTVFFLPNGLDRQRLGVIASKKIGNAVVRNLAKRKIREVFRNIKGKIEPAMDIVIVSVSRERFFNPSLSKDSLRGKFSFWPPRDL